MILSLFITVKVAGFKTGLVTVATTDENFVSKHSEDWLMVEPSSLLSVSVC